MDKILKEELMGKIEITDHGKKKTVTKLEALAKLLVSQSLKGNAKAQDRLLKLLPPELLADLESELSKMPTPEEDLALILKFAPELVAANGGPGDNSD